MNIVIALALLCTLLYLLDGSLDYAKAKWSGWRKHRWWFDRVRLVVILAAPLTGLAAICIGIVLGFMGELV